MLPLLTNAKRNLIAGVTVMAVLASGASPALAWGKNERNFLAGIAATLLVQEMLRDMRRNQQPVYRQPVVQDPVRYDPAPVSVYGTPMAQAFNMYSDAEQRRIQSSLSAFGYYRGTIDGSFGAGTYNALALYASRTNRVALMESRTGSFTLLDDLLF
jgi:Putative peptidoglycan binding domain